MSDNSQRTFYPPGAVPVPRTTMATPGASRPSALSSGASYNNLLHALTTQRAPTIQHPLSESPRHTPMPAAHPAPIYPAPVHVDPVLIRIKFLTDTFNAAATNDPIFYKLYCNVRNAQSHNNEYPDLVFFLRLQLQVGWVQFLVDTHRENEIEHDTAALIRERKSLIEWLVQQDRTIKQRFGQYLHQQLSRFAPLDFDPWQTHPVASLIDRLYALETNAFFEPANVPMPTRQEYRIRVVTFLEYEGGWPQIYQDVNIWKQIGWTQMERLLSALTQNIQSAQLHYNHGWQSGGYHGHWLYLVGEEEESNRVLDSDYSLQAMKGFLAQGQSISIIHSQQVEIRDNLDLADALGLELDRPFQFCKHLPAGYTSEIMGAYPNPLPFSYLSRRVMSDHDLVIRVRRGKRSEAARRAKHRHDKEVKAKNKGALAVLASRPKV
ncbi:uncharacterized protein M437DRAFT_62054 [Aureobasidium melanogenum CBS 110374]|uniref:Uncharacterized protein n=1 Tax=Aureobasidium melanogenum (strain CBS 110374) TaxID=1043003 RepID=A0A074W3I4_AURM1|nr:uncharacterized protein M437DRAFT_62054 [Aureobasidium melanogenum CBS 110374]KEQ67670.1 hypothetical protein M437DRAFT_62054 [Aureobasidium melanogenum CBS 110374]